MSVTTFTALAIRGSQCLLVHGRYTSFCGYHPIKRIMRWFITQLSNFFTIIAVYLSFIYNSLYSADPFQFRYTFCHKIKGPQLRFQSSFWLTWLAKIWMKPKGIFLTQVHESIVPAFKRCHLVFTWMIWSVVCCYVCRRLPVQVHFYDSKSVYYILL
jgi:hypothetical protein